MKQVTAGKTVEGEKKTGTVLYDFGESLEESINKFGEEVVHSSFVSDVDRKLKTAIRKELDAGTEPEDIPEKLKDWRPDTIHKVEKDPFKMAMEKASEMTPEERNKALKELRAKIAG